MLLLVITLISAGCSLAENRGMTPQQLASLQQVGSALVSEDGRYIAYTQIIPRDPVQANAPSAVEFRMYDRQTGQTTEIEFSGRAGNIQVRPGHNTFSFTGRGSDDDAVALHEYNPASGEVTKLFEHTGNIQAYSWHPEGTRFSFVTPEVLDLPESPLPYEPTVYEENIPNRHGFIMDVGGDEPLPIRIEGTIYLMSWSPDGNWLAISETPTPNIDDFYMFQQVKVINASSGHVRNTIDNAGKLAQITWSPDGRQLALRAGHDINDPIDGRIMVVSSRGGTPQNIYPDYLGKFEYISWTDEGRIRFLASESTARVYGTIHPSGRGFSLDLAPEVLVIDAYSIAGDGTVVFTAQTPQHPREIFVLDPGATEPERLTNSNEWLDTVPMGRQVVVSYEARDGRNIEGLLIYPLEETGGPYPTIVMVHGGPEAHYSNGWLTGYSMPGQVGAARGFATFYPNYRGSTGRGIEFIYSSQGDLAGAEFDDVVDGVDYLIDRGITDPERVGVTGGSYGGYATAWMSTRYSHRFAAGVMFVGISNNISKWGTSDIPEELYLVHSRKRVWDHWQWNLERSPIYHVGNAQTPLLIMHGEDDTRVHPAQSLELFRHIKVRKPEVPLRLVWYPNEGHGNVRSTSRFDYNLRMLRWFETYLLHEEPQKPPFHLDFGALGVELPD